MNKMTTPTISTLAISTLVTALLTLGACGGANDSGNEVGTTSGIDNCTLLTDDEVSAFAGTELVQGQDSPLGCGFAEPDAAVADFSILATESDQPLAEVAAELAPALELRDLMGGDFDEAVALYDGDEANFLLVRRGDLRVLLVMTFLDITTDRVGDAVRLAETALDRADVTR